MTDSKCLCPEESQKNYDHSKCSNRCMVCRHEWHSRILDILEGFEERLQKIEGFLNL